MSVDQNRVGLNQLCCTNDYDQFIPNAFNRDVKKIGPLMQSMREQGFLAAYPLHCNPHENPRYKIVKAGHHRLEVAKSLGIPVYYVVTNDTASIVELEKATNPWKPIDYVQSFARTGNLAYIELLEWIDATGLSVEPLANILAGHQASSNNQMTRIKAGTFKITDHGRRLTSRVLKVVDAARVAGLAFARKKHFVSALSKLLMLDEVCVDRLANKIKAHPKCIDNCPDQDKFLLALDHIYNYRACDRVNVAFLATEAAKKRNAVTRFTASSVAAE